MKKTYSRAVKKSDIIKSILSGNKFSRIGIKQPSHKVVNAVINDYLEILRGNIAGGHVSQMPYLGAIQVKMHMYKIGQAPKYSKALLHSQGKKVYCYNTHTPGMYAMTSMVSGLCLKNGMEFHPGPTLKSMITENLNNGKKYKKS